MMTHVTVMVATWRYLGNTINYAVISANTHQCKTVVFASLKKTVEGSPKIRPAS